MPVIVTSLLPLHTKRRSGQPIPKVLFLVAHDTGNEGSTARQNVTFYTRTAADESASAHLFVDDEDIIECVPTGLSIGGIVQAEKAWHVRYDEQADNSLYGEDANDGAIGVELCYGPNINADKAYANYVWVMGQLCQVYNLEPLHKIAGHFQLDPKRRTDPVNALSKSGRTFGQLLVDISMEVAHLSGTGMVMGGRQPIAPTPTAQVTTVNLRIRTHPSTKGIILRTVPTGTRLLATDTISGETVQGVSCWYSDEHGAWWWGGGVKNV